MWYELPYGNLRTCLLKAALPRHLTKPPNSWPASHPTTYSPGYIDTDEHSNVILVTTELKPILFCNFCLKIRP